MTHPPSRRARLLGELEHELNSLRGLEFGPLTNPIVSAVEAQISYVDYLSGDGLREKYRDDPNVDRTKIVDVDVILEGGRLPASALNGSFDYAVASHVLEHLPDPIGWLQQCSAALKPGGMLCLALPDKRYTWDILRRETELWEWVEGYLTRQVQPSPGAVFAATSQTALMPVGTPWQREPTTEELQPERDLRAALELAQSAVDAHVDVHCSIFAPARFLRLLSDVHDLGLCSFELAYFEDTRRDEIEFLVRLRNRPDVDHHHASRALLDAAETTGGASRRGVRRPAAWPFPGRRR